MDDPGFIAVLADSGDWLAPMRELIDETRAETQRLQEDAMRLRAEKTRLQVELLELQNRRLELQNRAMWARLMNRPA